MHPLLPLLVAASPSLARDALARMKGLERATPRERGFVEAAR